METEKPWVKIAVVVCVVMIVGYALAAIILHNRCNPSKAGVSRVRGYGAQVEVCDGVEWVSPSLEEIKVRAK